MKKSKYSFIRTIYALLADLVNDTLKKYDPKKKRLRFSRTSLTMVTAWFTVLYSYLYDLHTKGFRVEAFTLLVAVSLGVKVTDGIANKLNRAPKEEETEAC